MKNLNPSFDFRREEPSEFNTYHTFVIQCSKRNALKRYLLENGIETAIHLSDSNPQTRGLCENVGPHSRALEKSEKIRENTVTTYSSIFRKRKISH